MNYRFSDLVDVDAFQAMLRSFYDTTGILHGLVDEDGQVISAAGWQDACEKFHYGHPVTRERCEESSRRVSANLGACGYAGGKCLNGLMDYGTAVVVDGQQLAMLYFGQMLHEPPDIEFFRRQAKEFGFDEEHYLAAIRQLPVIPKERVETIMKFYVALAQTLARSGLDRLRQIEADRRLVELNRELDDRVARRTAELAARNDELATEVAEHRRTANALFNSRAQLQAIVDSSPNGIGWSRDGKVEYLNKRFTELFGYVREDVPTLDAWYRLAYPDERLRNELVHPWIKAVNAARIDGVEPPTLDVPVVCKDGGIRRVIVGVSWIGDLRLVNFSDITEHWQVKQREQARSTVLELIARDASLEQTLAALVRSIEAEDRRMICSIVLLAEDGRHIAACIAPGLPDYYNEAVATLEIGDGVGSCGTAAYTRRRVVVEDIQTHPYWAPFTDLARRVGVAACWSEPIFSAKGEVLGTFAIYHRQPCAPDEEDLQRIARAANFASIAIERHRIQQELERQATTDFLTGLANRRRFIDLAASGLARAKRYGESFALLMIDVDHFKAVNDSRGHQCGDQVLKRLAEMLRSAVRESDLVARLGGEEFAVMLPNSSEDRAVQTAERLRLAAADTDISVEGGEPLRITLSVGVAPFGGATATDIDMLLKQADDALYEAKNSGRNRVCVRRAWTG